MENSNMTATVEPVQPENNFNVNKDKFSLSSSKEDHDIHSLLPNGNEIDHSLPVIVTDTSCDKSTESSVISLENTRSLVEERHLDTGYTGKDYAVLSSKDSCMTLAVPKLSAKYRKSKGISKRLQYRKQRAASRNSFLFSYSLSMVCVVMRLLKAETAECSDIVTWDVKTKPILFGETLELVCNIFDEENLCKGSFQQWYGSKQDTLLCQDGKCRNEEKYTFKKNANCNNSLLIHNLSISDVDISYSCAFGRNEMKKGLMMKDYEFLKLPRNSSVSPSLTINDSIVDVSLKIDGIYPEPNCTIILHERDITGKANISSTVNQAGLFFTYNMHIMHNVSKKDCGSPLVVNCYIGSFTVTNYTRELDNCTVSEKDTERADTDETSTCINVADNNSDRAEHETDELYSYDTNGKRHEQTSL
ncbi:uncharacterized protein LOC127712268 isoform X2 [Mytilus californianus]|uniref:uncharacterized protein LOC127712268 isoform X2 n=1 Tax=Mytilus californianus TaxID=6549 RepID=UPI0022482C6A|nr:uncharacterized protein LOC127712268 isoform X2 [Mytilus californianus]